MTELKKGFYKNEANELFYFHGDKIEDIKGNKYDLDQINTADFIRTDIDAYLRSLRKKIKQVEDFVSEMELYDEDKK